MHLGLVKVGPGAEKMYLGLVKVGPDTRKLQEIYLTSDMQTNNTSLKFFPDKQVYKYNRSKSSCKERHGINK